MLLLVLLLSTAAGASDGVKLVFGSCWHQELHAYSQPVWNAVAREQADTFVWLGDAIYGDRRIFLSRFEPNSAAELQRLYNLQLADPAYQAVLRSLRGPPLGIWDDHDYGINNGDGSFPGKEVSKQQFLDFLGEPPTSPLRAAGETLFAAHELAGGSVLLLMLDVRFAASASSVLGERQWALLERALTARPRQLVVVASGIQVRRKKKRSWKRFELPLFCRCCRERGRRRRAGRSGRRSGTVCWGCCGGPGAAACCSRGMCTLAS